MYFFVFSSRRRKQNKFIDILLQLPWGHLLKWLNWDDWRLKSNLLLCYIPKAFLPTALMAESKFCYRATQITKRFSAVVDPEYVYKPLSCVSVREIKSVLADPKWRLTPLMTERWHRILFRLAPKAPDPPNWFSLFKRPNHERHHCQSDGFHFQIRLSLLFITDEKLSDILSQIYRQQSQLVYIQTTLWWSHMRTYAFSASVRAHRV